MKNNDLEISNTNENSQQDSNENQQSHLPLKKKNNVVLIVFSVIGGVIVGIVVLIFIIISLVSAPSNKLVCKSNEGNITIMYNESEIVGYTASGITYDLDSQKKYAKQIGVQSYLEEFDTFFKTNTTGECIKNEK